MIVLISLFVIVFPAMVSAYSVFSLGGTGGSLYGADRIVSITTGITAALRYGPNENMIGTVNTTYLEYNFTGITGPNYITTTAASNENIAGQVANVMLNKLNTFSFPPDRPSYQNGRPITYLSTLRPELTACQLKYLIGPECVNSGNQYYRCTPSQYGSKSVSRSWISARAAPNQNCEFRICTFTWEYECTPGTRSASTNYYVEERKTEVDGETVYPLKLPS